MNKALTSVLFIPLAGLFVLASVWVGVTMRVDTERREAIRSAQVRVDILADALAQRTAKTIHDIDVIALLVKHEFEANPAEFRLNSLLRAGLITSDSAAHVSVVDKKGHVTQSTIPYAVDTYLIDREHFRVHIRPDVQGSFISEPVKGRASGKWAIQLTRRLETSHGKFAGVVVVSEDRSYLTQSFANQVSLSPNDSISIETNDGVRLSGKANVTEKSHAARRTGILSWPIWGTETLSGDVSAHRPVKGYPLQVSVRLPNRDTLKAYVEMRRVYFVSAAFLSVVFVVFLAVVVILFHRLLKNREEWKVLSRTDILTGLWSRHGMLRQLHAALNRQSILHQLAVLFIDFDNLKKVNDTLGHDAGDHLLRKMASRLKQALEPHITGRFCGDEFLVILTTQDHDTDVLSAVEKVVDRLQVLFESPVSLRGNVFSVRASIGVAIHSRNDDTASSLIREASEAMYAAKARMSRTHSIECCIYSAEMREKACHVVDVEQTLRAALDKGQLALRFIPILTVKEGCLYGFRVAVCIEGHKDLTLITHSMIPLNVENGLAGAVTEFVLRQILVQLRDWESTTIKLSYPLSEIQFLAVDCASMIQDMAQKLGCSPNMLQLEIPEKAFVEEPLLAHERTVALHQVGVGLVLSEFSGSFAAFGHLTHNPLDGVIFRPSTELADIVAATGHALMLSGYSVSLEGGWLANINPSGNASLQYNQIPDVEMPLDAPRARAIMLSEV